MFLAELPLRNSDETRQTSLGCKQVVKTSIEPLVSNVVADGKQMARVVVEKCEIHFLQFTATARDPPTVLFDPSRNETK